MASNRLILIPFLALLVASCAEAGGACSGFEVTSADGDTSFTVSQLMTHAAAMGMTQQEAETLIYLEGITSSADIKAGDSLCIDGIPGG